MICSVGPYVSKFKSLSGTDPQVLEDVKRALKLKVRREARMQAVRASSSLHSDDPSVQPETILTMPTESQVDFRPSVGLNKLHPVPLSTNEGHTLDWGSSADDEKPDKRWSISIPKRRPKDRTINVSKEFVEGQAVMYSGMYTGRSSFAGHDLVLTSSRQAIQHQI